MNLSLSSLAFRGFSSAFTLLARLSPDVDEVWALTNGREHDFLLVLRPSLNAATAQKKWTPLFNWLSSIYAAAPERKRLSLLTAEEWNHLHPLFTAKGATRGVPLFQRQRWSPLPQPGRSPAHFPLKDRIYRAMALFEPFQVLLRQHAYKNRAQTIFATQLKLRLEKALGCQIPHDANWSARFLRRLNQLGESLHETNGNEIPPFNRTAEEPLGLPDGFTFADKNVLRFARQGNVDHWIVAPLTDEDFEHALEAYRTTERGFSLLSPAAFHALHQNFPFRAWNFWDANAGQMETPPCWADPDRVAIEVLQAALNRPLPSDERELPWGLAEVEKGSSWVYKGHSKGNTHEENSDFTTSPDSIFHGGPRRRA